jgi:putative heme iron utilization protein
MLASATDLARYLAGNPGAVIETVAGEREVSPRAVVQALPPRCGALRLVTRSSTRWRMSPNGVT